MTFNPDKKYHVTTDASAEFIMDAPMHVIANVFCLHRMAIERIEHEAESNVGGCLIHIARGDPFPRFGPSYRFFVKNERMTAWVTGIDGSVWFVGVV